MKDDERHILEFSVFDDEVSLWQLIYPGDGKVRGQFEDIIESLEHRQYSKTPPVSVLIVGKEGKRLHAASFLKGLGKDVIRSAPARYFTSVEEVKRLLMHTQEYFGYIVSQFEPLEHLNYSLLCEIISNGTYTVFEKMKNAWITYHLNNPIIVTAEKISLVPQCMVEKFDHIVFLQDYTPEQIREIIEQRLDFCRIDYDGQFIDSVMRLSGQSLKRAIRVIEACITVMQAREQERLSAEHLERAKSYLEMGDSNLF
jgi:hypothetical protein